MSVPISIQLRILGTFLILVKRLFRQSKKGGGGPAQSAKSDLDQLVNCTLNALDSFSWKSWTLMVFVLKNYFLLSLMLLLNFSIPFVQKQFHIGFHNGWKCRLGITIDVTYRMNSIQKRGGVELLLVSADYSQIEFNCDYLLISSKDSIRHSFQYVVLNLSLNKPLIKGAFFFCSEPLVL